MARSPQPKFSPRTFLAKVGEGPAIGRFGADQDVFSQGDPAEAVYYIQDGKVKLTVVSEQSKEAVIAILTCNVFGEGCLAGQTMRMASATAMAPSVIVRIEKAAILGVIHQEPGRIVRRWSRRTGHQAHQTLTAARPNGQPFMDDERAMARAVVDAMREPVLLLDRGLRVVAANPAYCLTFRADRKDVQGRLIRAVDGGRWDTPKVRAMLARIRVRSIAEECREVEQDVPGSARRTLLLHARATLQHGRAGRHILLAIEDVSERRAAERESARLIQQMETLLLASQHQIANSLQVIASILLLKARSVQSPETRTHLENVHWRILSVATVQRQLLGSKDAGRVALAPYLTQLCETLAASMVGESRPVSIACRVDRGTVSATEAVSMGLIVTELVINALKHAFVDDRATGRIVVTYDLDGDTWRLAVSDDGIGKRVHAATTGLGTSIIEALVSQLDGLLEVATGPSGTTVSISHRARRGEAQRPAIDATNAPSSMPRGSAWIGPAGPCVGSTPRRLAHRPSEASHPENPG